MAGTGYLNTLDDNDILTGTGTNAVLNVEFGAENDISDNSNVQPTLINIKTVNAEWTANDTNTLNLSDADSVLSDVNINRITANNAAITVEDMGASVRNTRLRDATKGGTVTLDWREEVLTGSGNTAETLNMALDGARVAVLNLQEGGDGAADQGHFFETINVNSTGNNDIDRLNVQANGREDLLNNQAADTTKQALNLNVTSGTLEINNLQAPGVDNIAISVSANTRLDIAADKAAPLSLQNDGISTPDLESITITGEGAVMIDGLDTTEQASGETLTVSAANHSGGLKLGVVSGSDTNVTGSGVAGIPVDETARTADIDLSVTTGSGNDEIEIYSNLAGTINTGSGNDSVILGTLVTTTTPAIFARGDLDFTLMDQSSGGSSALNGGDSLVLQFTDSSGNRLGSPIIVNAPGVGAYTTDSRVELFAIEVTRAIETQARLLGATNVQLIIDDAEANSNFSGGHDIDLDINYEFDADLYISALRASQFANGSVVSDDNDGQLISSGPWDIESPFQIFTPATTTTSFEFSDMEGLSVIDTGSGEDTVQVRDMLAFGDLTGDQRDSGADSAAIINTGNDIDNITVRNMGRAVKWDDNNPSDANADDLYSFIGAVINAGSGSDTLNISGTMAENSIINMGNDGDTVNYNIANLASVMDDDTNDIQEVISVDSTTETQETLTIDRNGALIDLGSGNDRIEFTDMDLGESSLTLLAAATNVDGAGAKLIGDLGNDTFSLVTTDVINVIDAASLANDDRLITGIERVDLIIENSVDAATSIITGATVTDTNDTTTDTTVTLNVERLDNALGQINLVSREQTLRTLTNSEQYESGQNTGFTVNNMRTGVALSLSAFDATAVVSATNGPAGTQVGRYADDGAIDLYTATSNIATQNDVSLTLNFDRADADSDSDAFTIALTNGSYGVANPRTGARAGFDLDLNMGATTFQPGWDATTSLTDDNDLVIENLTLALGDDDSHLINLNGFGDSQQSDTRTNQVNTVGTSLTVTGSAAGANIDLFNVTADTITANIAANVDIYVGSLSNKYTITTGSGNDNVHMGNDLVTPNLTTVPGDESDAINLGTGTDRLVISGSNDLISTGTAAVEPDGFSRISGVEILRIDTNFGGDTNVITMDETATVTGINTIEITGDGDQDTSITLSENFNNDFTLISAVMGVSAATNLAVLDHDNDNRFTPRDNEATSLTFDIQDVILDSDIVNTNITLGLNAGSQLTFVNAGLEQANLAVNVIVASTGTTTVHGSMRGINNGTAPTFVDGTALNTNANPYSTNSGTLRIVNQDNAASIDSITLLENETDNENGITLVVDNSWSIGATKTLTINAGGILNTDNTVTSGGLNLDGSMELDGRLVIIGTTNNDTILGGNGNDTITGGRGNDTLRGDSSGLIVIDGIQQQSTLTFADDTTAELGDTYTVTIGNDTIVYRLGEFDYTLNGTATGYQGSAIATTIDGLKTWLANTFNALDADADADADVNLTTVVTVDPVSNAITINGIDVAANNDGLNSALGETITVNATVQNTGAAVKEVISINLNGAVGEDYNAGETITYTFDADGAGGNAPLTASYVVGAGLPLGTIVDDATVASGLAAAINSAAMNANVTATAAAGVITIEADAAGTSFLYSDSSVSLTGESAYAKTYEYAISALSELGGTQLTVTVNGNTWTSAIYSDDAVTNGTQDIQDLTNLLLDPDGAGAATSLQDFLKTQLNNNNIVVTAATPGTFTISGAIGSTAADFTGPSFNLLNTGGSVTTTLTKVAADATATVINKAATAYDIKLETLGTAVGAEPNADVDVITGRTAVAAEIGAASVDVFVQGTEDSTAISVLQADGLFAIGNNLAFGNGVDQIIGFTAGAGGDLLDLVSASAAVSALGVSNVGLAAGTNYFLSGNWVAGVFTVAANGDGADTLIIQGYAGVGSDIDTNTSAILLVGVDSDNLNVANFAL